MEKQNKPILDVCCGSRMFWFDKENPLALFTDIRDFEDTLCDGRKISVKPDKIEDCTNLSFADNTFKLVVFDPPHLVRAGENSWLAKKYGVINSPMWSHKATVQELIEHFNIKDR